MQDLTFTPSTAIILLVVAALVVLAVRRMVRKGLCDCHGDGGCSGCSGCSHGAASKASADGAGTAGPSCSCAAVREMSDRLSRL